MEQVLEYVVQGNSAQLAGGAFVSELKAWIRFSDADAVRTRPRLTKCADPAACERACCRA